MIALRYLKVLKYLSAARAAHRDFASGVPSNDAIVPAAVPTIRRIPRRQRLA